MFRFCWNCFEWLLAKKHHLQPPKTTFLPQIILKIKIQKLQILYTISKCHLYVTRMYSCVIRMSLGATRMSSVCHSYVLVCHPYVTRMSSVCHSYVVLPWTVVVNGVMSLVCSFTMSRCYNSKLLQSRKLTWNWLESLKQDQYRWSTRSYSIQIILLLWIIAAKP